MLISFIKALSKESMRRVLMLSIMVILMASCQKGQKVNTSQVPDAVTRSFYERYPVATEINWRKDSPVYMVQFNYDSEPKKAKFRYDGTFLEAK